MPSPPIGDTRQLLEDAGLIVDHIERHDTALAETIEIVETRLPAVRLVVPRPL